MITGGVNDWYWSIMALLKRFGEHIGGRYDTPRLHVHRKLAPINT